MSIRVECPNGSCAKNLKVKDEMAGKAVKCRACGTVLKVPAGAVNPGPQPGSAVREFTEAASAPTATAGLWETIERQCRVNRLDSVARNVFGGGLVALFVLAVSTFFNWSIGFIPFAIAGIQTASGMLVFLLSLAAGGFAGWTFFKKAEWFPYAIYAAGSGGVFIFLYLLVQVFRFSSLTGFGLYLGVLAALGVWSTFGYLAFRPLKK
jgi:hypothetical protein